MLSQSESVVVDFFAKPAAIFANFVLDFCKLRLGLLSYLYHIELSWNVTCQKIKKKNLHWTFQFLPQQNQRAVLKKLLLCLKFIYSEKDTQFCVISIVDLSYVVPAKSTEEILQNFVAFSEQGPSINNVVSRGEVKNCQFYLIKRQLRGGKGSKIANFETIQLMEGLYDF